MSMTVGLNSDMFRILSQMSRLQAEQQVTMARLATGNRINRASDDPAGLIALNSLNAEKAAVDAAIEGNQRSQSMLNVADSALTEVSSLMSEIEELTLQAQGSTVTAEEKAAYQAQIDNAIDSIDRLINQAAFNGKKIFNGANRINAYTADSSDITDIRVYSRDPNVSGSLALTVNVTAAADHAHTDSSTGFDMNNGLSAATVIQVTGKLGTATITMSTLASAGIKAAINAQKQVTGVSASVGVSDNLVFSSTSKGSDSFVTVSVISGDATMLTDGNFSKVSGTDAEVTVNGTDANATGTKVFYNGTGVSLSFNIEDDTPGTHTITVAGGGAEFKLGTDSSTSAALGLGYVNTFELGRSDLGYLSSLKSGGANALTVDDNDAVEIAREASNQVASIAARIGSFNKYAVGSSISALQAQQEGLVQAIDPIQNTDYATETANLQRQQILMNAAVSALGLASSQQANVLALLS